MKKQLIMSVRPEHLVNILNGKKTLEIRKRIPKDFKGWVNLRCSKSNKSFYLNNSVNILNETIPCRFWFDEYDVLEIGDDGHDWFLNGKQYYYSNSYSKPAILEELYLDDDEVLEYVGYGTDASMGNQYDKAFLMYIKKLEIFDEPKELGDFYKINHTKITKAPQSWMYCYALQKQ